MIQKPETGNSKLILPGVFSAAFLALYILLSHNNRFAADDFFFLKHVNESGIWNGMIFSYQTWVTRWAAILFLDIILKCSNLFHSLLPYHLFTIIAFIFVLMNLIKVVFARFFQTGISFGTRLLYSVLFTASFFFFTFNTGETWFWITSTAMYLWSIVFFVAGVVLILQLRKNRMSKIACAGCFLFIGGASESVAVSILVLLLAGIIYNSRQNTLTLKTFYANERNNMLLIAIASIVTALIISYTGEGRVLRQSALPDTGILKALFISAKSFVKLVLFQLPLKIHWFVFFSVPWIYLGHQFAPEKKESLERIFKKLAGFVVIFLLLSFVSFIPISLLLGETGPFRTWILVSFYLTLCCVACGFYLGYKAEWNIKLLNRTFNLSLVTLIGLMIINLRGQNKITANYAAAVDQRMNNLVQLKEQGEKNTVVLDALPPAGMLYSAEISEDTSHFSNRHVRDFLDLKFEIRRLP